MKFEHETIDDDPPCGRLNSCQTTDLTGNGLPDVIVTGMGANPSVSLAGKRINLRALPGVDRVFSALETNIFWYENPGWERHELSTQSGVHPGVGSALHDVDGDGRTDLLVGQGYRHSDLYWYRQLRDPRDPWTQYFISDAFQKYHDLTVGDVDNDGDPELVGLSQEAQTIFYYDIPADPTVEPWPDANCTVVDDGTAAEGLYVGDVDNDGRNELVAGTAIYRQGGETWSRQQYATGWDDVRLAVADIDGDDLPEIVLSEGDSPTYGTHPGRVAWFDTSDWRPTFLAEELFCPHSLQVADFDGDGHLDIFVGEMSLGENDRPTHYLFENRGDGTFDRHTLAGDPPTHEARAVDLTGDGRVDIVGKSYTPDHHVDVWINSLDSRSEATSSDHLS